MEPYYLGKKSFLFLSISWPASPTISGSRTFAGQGIGQAPEDRHGTRRADELWQSKMPMFAM